MNIVISKDDQRGMCNINKQCVTIQIHQLYKTYELL